MNYRKDYVMTGSFVAGRLYQGKVPEDVLESVQDLDFAMRKWHDCWLLTQTNTTEEEYDLHECHAVGFVGNRLVSMWCVLHNGQTDHEDADYYVWIYLDDENCAESKSWTDSKTSSGTIPW